MSSDRHDDRKDREYRTGRPNDTNRNDSKSIRCRVFVGNLATEDLSRQEFEEIFAKHGRVIGCSVHNGYGFVQYEKESSADIAVEKQHGTTIKGKRVDVNLAGDRRKPEKRRPPPPAGRGRGYPGDRPRDHSPPPRGGRRSDDDPFAIPGYREARDRYRNEHGDADRPADSPYGRPHDEVPSKKLRPDYDFAPLSRDPLPPSIGKPVEAPIDCEIIIINKQQMAYAESVEKKLKSHGLVVECAHLPETVPLLDELDDASKRGVLFGIIISSQHEVHHSVTVHILHGTQQEHRNMPLEDAILLVSRNFDTYMQALRDRELRPAISADPHAPKKGYAGTPGAVSSVVPSPYTREVSTLLNIAADGRPLTVDEYTLVIDEFTKLRNDLLKKEGRVPPSPAGSTYQPYATDPQSIALQQAELQAKILSILNPGTKLTTENKPSGNEAASVASSKPSIAVLTPSNSASNAFKAPSTLAQNASQSQTSNIIGMALSSIRSGATSQSGTPTSAQGATANPSYSNATSYSGYPSSTDRSWSQAHYRSPVPNPSQHRGPAPRPSQLRGPAPSPSQPARPTGSPGYPRYPAPGQMNNRGGYRASHPNSYPPPQARY